MANALETFVSSLHNNVILRDNDGKPSIFVKHPKVNSSFFHDSLPNEPHPAFKCGNEVDDGVLIAKYAASELVPGGTLYSLPNAVPCSPTYGSVTDWSYSIMCNRASSFPEAVAMTIADYGLYVLTSQKNGYLIAHGNNNKGNDTNNGKVSTIFNTGVSVTAGKMVLYLGWVYECLITHTTSNLLLPSNTPSHWRSTGIKLGGTVGWTNQYNYTKTLTGSGPLNWYLYNDINNEADMTGNVRTFLRGFRLLKGEIQIVPNANDPSVDCTETSTEWKAILPHNSDNGYDFVAPGTAGTVHYLWINNQVTLAGRAANDDAELPGQRECEFYDIKTDITSLPYVPYILYELGLAPLNVSSNQKVSSKYIIQLNKNNTLTYGVFGNTPYGDDPTVACLYTFVGYNDGMIPHGVRQRARLKAQ